MSLAFLEQRLDPRITRGVHFTETVPGRTMVRLPVGTLKQNFTASLPITRGDLSHGMRSAADYQVTLDAWYIVNFTPYSGLRVKNWRDYTLTQANSRLTLISGSTYQIKRVHAFGGVEFLRPIYKPVAGVIVIRNRGGTISTATASVATTTGIATISGHAGGDTYSAEGEFDLPMTFSDNEWGASLEVGTQNLHLISGNVAMEEIRL